MTSSGWKYTPAGRAFRFIGSVRFAVPLLAVVAAAMIWGTWIDSTQGRDRAFDVVYGSLWFIGLMALVCASLIFSVVTRYPWKRKHIGFIVVHASLIGLIVVGFFTMFTKLEGRVILGEGDRAGAMQMDAQQLELLEHGDAGFVPRESVTLAGQRTLRLGGVELRVVDTWANTSRQMEVSNTRAEPLHAAEMSLEPGATEGVWIEEESPTLLGDLTVHVVAQGGAWTPPASQTAEAVLVGGDGAAHALEPGAALGESGWTVTSVEYFQRATIGQGGITERADGAPNPAVKVILTYTDGSSERHTAFERFRDSPFKQQISGESSAPFTLTYRGESLHGPTLAIMREEGGRVHALYAEPGAEPVAFEHDGDWPWVIIAGTRHVTVLRDYDRAAGTERVVEAPAAESTRPAVVVAGAGVEGEGTPVLWNTPTHVAVGDKTLVLRYGPVTYPLPFEIQLVDFRKSDYPGSEMAMAYESDVRVALPEAEAFDFNIHMNHPYHHAGWKVYQSGYQGDDVSIFQVTRDPGLGYMYFFCTTLCIGIVVTFYSRSLSWGHPDIPAPFQGSSH